MTYECLRQTWIGWFALSGRRGSHSPVTLQPGPCLWIPACLFNQEAPGTMQINFLRDGDPVFQPQTCCSTSILPCGGSKKLAGDQKDDGFPSFHVLVDTNNNNKKTRGSQPKVTKTRGFRPEKPPGAVHHVAGRCEASASAPPADRRCHGGGQSEKS